MGVKVIKEGDKPTTIPCNVCDGEFKKEEYEGTNTGICKGCLSKRTPEQVKDIFAIVNFTRKFREERKLQFNWFDVRYLILKVWNEMKVADFRTEMTKILMGPYQLTKENVDEIWKHLGENNGK